MSATVVVGLIEEMINLKVQQHAEATLKATPDIARLLQDKRETDRRRLEQIKAQLVRILEGEEHAERTY